MSVEIWPSIAPDQLKIEEDATQDRELTWLLATLHETLKSLKHGLEDSYALLAPIDPGSTLVLSTRNNEAVKGHVTRVGTRIVKGTVHLKLRTLPPQTMAIDPSRPIHLPALATLNTLLTEAVDLVALCVSEGPAAWTASFLSTQLRLLAQHLAEASAIIKGPPSIPETRRTPSSSRSRPSSSSSSSHSPTNTPTIPRATDPTGWTRTSVSLSHFLPPTSRNLSFYLTIQDASLVLYLRALEPADAPMNLGAKLAFAIGTARRLEHDEADRVFGYCCDESTHVEDAAGGAGGVRNPVSPSDANKTGGVGFEDATAKKGADEVEVFVREKVRVESADPSLLSMSAKLGALANTLNLARRNLAAVMGEVWTED
ncbi:Uu.00g115960.m01.CDS01 [Anthostomella pinea]|uniref:Uu.00g115960.m01.CDS01 n=1 Tax=Anthostomella pinea TaxID=933095 RepID=A0AAI8YGX7_9PEZI|nr:Uu.00g115960.m01.CDS01 [Anthostomella pinea]